MNPTLRKPLIAGNWKMYKTVAEAVQTAKDLVQCTAPRADSVPFE
jgi:triosephosphate isomerase